MKEGNKYCVISAGLSLILMLGICVMYIRIGPTIYNDAISYAIATNDEHHLSPEVSSDTNMEPGVIISLDTNMDPGSLGTYQSEFKNPCWFAKKPFTMETIRCMPYFYVVGFGKSGTTTLCNFLSKHQDIAIPMRKELAFWMTGKTKREVLSGYVPMFQSAAREIYNSTIEWGGFEHYHQKITYDCTPRYVWHINTLPQAILGTDKRTKFVMIMRQPTDRLYSHYHHSGILRKRSFNPKQFHYAVLSQIRNIKYCEKTKSIVACVKEAKKKRPEKTGVSICASIYYAYAKIWLDAFPSQQILFIKAEELYERSEQIMRGVYTFLELSVPSNLTIAEITKTKKQYIPPGMPTLDEPSKKYLANTTLVREDRSKWDKYKDTMWPSTRKLLDEFYGPYNKMLATLLNDDKYLFK